MIVLTSTVATARTDKANVFIRLHGTHSNSNERQLTTEKTHFEGGQTNIFQFVVHDIGNLEAITIRYDNPDNPWKLVHVSVVDTNEDKAWKCQFSEFIGGKYDSTTKSCGRGKKYIISDTVHYSSSNCSYFKPY